MTSNTPLYRVVTTSIDPMRHAHQKGARYTSAPVPWDRAVAYLHYDAVRYAATLGRGGLTAYRPAAPGRPAYQTVIEAVTE